VQRAVNIGARSGVSRQYYCLNIASKEFEIQKAAQNMVERYGQNALKEANLRVLELEARHQKEALGLWREIQKRVELLVLGSTDNPKH